MSSLPYGWTLSNLGACADWYSGGTPDTSISAYWSGDIPWITASSLHNFYISQSERQLTKLGVENGTRLMPENTIIFVVRGMSLKTEFRIGISRRAVAFGQDCKALTAKSGIDAWYLAYAMRSRSREILGLVDEASHGTGRLQTDALKQLEILIPPLVEQERIAASVRLLDNKIELNRRMNATLEEMASTLFNASFTKSEEAKDWETGKLSEIASISREAITPMDYPEEIFNHYSIPAFDDSGFPKQEKGQEIKSNKFVVQDHCVMLSKLNPRIKRIWLPFPLEGYSICSTEFLVTEPNAQISQAYLFSLFGSQLFQDRFVSMVTGTSGSHQRVKAEYVLDIEISMPSKDAITAFSDVAKPLLEKYQHNILESRTLASLRDTLLPKLMSGEVRVKA